MRYKGKTYYTREELRKMGIKYDTIVNWFSRGKREGIKKIEIKKTVLAIDEETFKRKLEVMKEFQKRYGVEVTEIDAKEKEDTKVEGKTEGAHWC